MKRPRIFAASVVITIGSLAACRANDTSHPEIIEHHNPPRATVTITPTTDPPDPVLDPKPEPTTDNTLPDAPIGQKGQVLRENGQCFWLPAIPEAKDLCPDPKLTCNPPPPPMKVPVKCPQEDAILPDAPVGASVMTRDDGSCFYHVSSDMHCPPHRRCNPPPPYDVTVRCPKQ